LYFDCVFLRRVWFYHHARLYYFLADESLGGFMPSEDKFVENIKLETGELDHDEIKAQNNGLCSC